MKQAFDFIMDIDSDTVDLMTALDDVGIEKNQDWDNEKTVWTFEDGSTITITNSSVEVSP